MQNLEIAIILIAHDMQLLKLISIFHSHNNSKTMKHSFPRWANDWTQKCFCILWKMIHHNGLPRHWLRLLPATYIIMLKPHDALCYYIYNWFRCSNLKYTFCVCMNVSLLLDRNMVKFARNKFLLLLDLWNEEHVAKEEIHFSKMQYFQKPHLRKYIHSLFESTLTSTDIVDS